MADKHHDESKLPLWAQERLKKLRSSVEDISRKFKSTQEAHAVLMDRNWFTLPGPQIDKEPFRLWILRNDDPHPVCSLKHGDVLMVGRAELKLTKEML